MIKHFEAFIGDKWMAWDENDTIAINKKGRYVTIVTDLKNGEVLTMKVDLDLTQAYAYY